jgi:hypothetical protein
VVDDAQDDLTATGAGGQQRRRSAGRVPQRVRGQVRDDPFHDRRIDHDPGQARRKAHHDRLCLRPDAAEAARDDLLQIGRPGKHRQRPGLQPAHIKQAGEQLGELVQGLIGGGQEFAMILGGQLDVV